MKRFIYLLAFVLLFVSACNPSDSPLPTTETPICPPDNVFGIQLHPLNWHQLSTVELVNSAGTRFRFTAEGALLSITLVSTGSSSSVELNPRNITVIPIVTENPNGTYTASGPIYFVLCGTLVFYNAEKIGEEINLDEPPTTDYYRA